MLYSMDSFHRYEKLFLFMFYDDIIILNVNHIRALEAMDLAGDTIKVMYLIVFLFL